MNLTLKVLQERLTVCKVRRLSAIDLNVVPLFIGRTEEELSMVCPTEAVPRETLAREDGWRGFSIVGILDFSLIGILSFVSSVLARERIGIFTVSTYNTDTILVKEENLQKALAALEKEGCTVLYT